MRLLLAGVALSLSLAAAAPPGALALPEGREYELVSPPFKGGYGATSVEAVSPDGLTVAFFSPGAFGGAPGGLSGGIDFLPYVAHRGASGWSTEPAMPPDTLLPYVLGASADASPALDSVLVFGAPGPNFAQAANGAVRELLAHPVGTPDVSENWEAIGAPLEAVTGVPIELNDRGQSADWCHVLLEGGGSGPAGELLEQAGTEHLYQPLYELVRGCGEETPALRLVGLNNKGGVINVGTPLNAACPVRGGGDSQLSEDPHFNLIASSGHEIFFTTCIANEGDKQVFVRLDGARTIELSRPLSEECGESGEQIPCREASKRPSAAFAGASEDGSRAFFLSAAPLSGEADHSENLWMAQLGCPESEPECRVANRGIRRLVRVSRDPNPGGEAGVMGASRVARDGSRVYFTAAGDLLSHTEQLEREAEGLPVPHAGAENLYVYDVNAEAVAFIAMLCSGYALSGTVEDPACPSASGHDSPVLEHAQTAGSDARFLVFQSYAQLTPDDTDAARDIYRYDALRGSLTRVSLGEGGYGANGNDAFGAELVASGALPETVRDQRNMVVRAISEDGSRIVFLTEGALSPAAQPGVPSAYEWHEGSVSLIAAGKSENPIRDVTISPAGGDVFFTTNQRLVPQDTDEATDVYDAHLCIAAAPCLPAQPAPVRSCEADGCQGALSAPAPLLVPGSVSQAPGEILPSAAGAPAPVTAKPRPKAKCRRRPRHRHRRACRAVAHGRSSRSGRA